MQESITQLCPPRLCDRDTARRGGLPTMLGESAALLRDIVSPQDARRDPTAGFTEPIVAEDGDAAPTDPKFRWDTLDDNQPVRFREFLTGVAAERAPDSRPTAHVLHLLLPHTPWHYLPSGVRYEAPEDLPTGGAAWWPYLARQRHLLQLGYADRLLGETLDALRASGAYDESLVVVTADHGVTFARDSVGRGMGHLRLSPTEVLWVPTFVKAPGQRTGEVDDRNWQHVDLVPTIADLAGLHVPWRMDGVSARGPRRTGSDKTFYDTPEARVTEDGVGRPGRHHEHPGRRTGPGGSAASGAGRPRGRRAAGDGRPDRPGRGAGAGHGGRRRAVRRGGPREWIAARPGLGVAAPGGARWGCARDRGQRQDRGGGAGAAGARRRAAFRRHGGGRVALPGER